MALGMMIPGMAAGWLQEHLGYNHFFIWIMICCIATFGVTALLKIHPNLERNLKKLMLNSTIQAIALFPFQTITYKTEDI